MELPNIPELQPNEKSLFWRIILRIGRFGQTTLGIIVIFILLTYTTLQSQWFQNWAIKKTTTYLSEKLGTPVKVDHISIDLLSKLDLQGFYIADQKGDTLIYAESFKVDYGLTWKTIYGKGFAIDGLLLENAKVFIKRKVGENNNNLQFVLDYLKGEEKPQTEQRGTPFDLKIKYLSFKKILFIQDDEIVGNKTTAYIDQAGISFEKFDLPQNQIHISAIEIAQPSIFIEDKERHPLPEMDEPIKKTTNETVKDTTKPKPLSFRLDKFLITDARFKYDNFRVSSKKEDKEIVDFNHLNISNLCFHLYDLNLQKDDLRAQLKEIAFKEESGFQLSTFNIKDIHFTPRRLELNSFQILTPNSNIGDTLILKYRSLADFDNFADKVLIEGHLGKSRLALKDLMPFDKKLATNDFFIQNKDDIFNISGNINGKVNSLKGSEIDISTKGLSFRGNLAARDLAKKDQETFNFKVERLLTDVKTIQLLVPNLEIPDEVKKLNKIDFTGFFDGFTYNFVAQGDLKTDLGEAIVDVQYVKDNPDTKMIQYKGSVELVNFDLGTMLDDEKLGKISLKTNLKNGFGSSKKDIKADVDATIGSFVFKGYDYKNLTMKGKIDKSFFDGDFSIKDDNIDFAFTGKVDFSDSIPIYNLDAKVKKINLRALKLTDEDIIVSGLASLNGKGTNENNIEGTASLKKLNFNYLRNYFYIDSLVVKSEITPYQFRRVEIKSEVLEGFAEGDFEFKRLPLSIKNYVVRNHPNMAERLDFALHPEAKIHDYVNINLHVLNSKNFTRLIVKQLDTLRNVKLLAHFDSRQDSIFYDISTPENVGFGGNFFKDVVLTAGIKNGFGDGYFGVRKSNFGGEELGAVLMPMRFMGDALDLKINADKLNKNIHNFNLDLDFFIEKEFLQLGFKPSSFYVGNDFWAVDTARNIRFDGKKLEVPNLILRNNNREITVSDINNRGIQAIATGFKFEDVSQIINDDRVNLEGDLFVNAKIDDIFSQKGIVATITADTVKWNKRDFGVLRIDATLKDLKSPVKFYTSLTNGNEQATFEGFYVLPGTSYESKGVTYQGGKIQGFAVTNNIPMIWIKYLAGEGLSNMEGKIDARLQVSGDLECPELRGQARVRDVSFKIDYLNTTYKIKDATANITDNYIDASGAKIFDELGNSASIIGGLSHQYFNYIRLNLLIDTENNDFLALNTTKSSGNLYYGKGIGKIRVRFSGSFERTFINVEKAITGKGTVLNIPVSNSQNADAVSFVRFIDTKKNTNINTTQELNMNGLSFDMTLTMTEDAEAQIIFDERAGDVIKGRGMGLIKFEAPMNSDFKMRGDFKFTDGKYLFTIRQNVINVDKPFNIRRGGTLTWSNGDPFGALMDITADYKGLRTAPYNLIADALPQSSVIEELSAKQTTDVDLTMHMTGQLLKPDIAFDIRFPTLIGNLKSYADNKLNRLSQDQAELNRQVFGLIVLGGFLPSGSTSANDFAVSTVNNTLSGLFSNQLSNYVNSWLRDVIKTNSVISSVDLDINTRGGLTPNTVVSINEVQVKPRFNLFDNRLSVDAGVVRGNDQDTNTYIRGDFAIEYILTDDRHIRIRAYNRAVQEIDGPRNRTGLGLAWRKEFNKWNELKKNNNK